MAASSSRATISVSGMHCASCVAAVEEALQETPGVVNASVNFASEKAYVTYDPALVDRAKLEAAIVDSGYGVMHETEPDAEQVTRIREMTELRTRFFLALGFGMPLLYVAMGPHIGLPIPVFIQSHLALVQLLLTAPIIAGSWQFYVRGVRSVVKHRTANMDTLVAVGTGAAFLWGSSGDMLPNS